MRARTLAVATLSFLLIGSAAAQTGPSAAAVEAPDAGSLAGPGPISASPLRDLQSGSPPVANAPKRSTGAVARVLGNGTALDYSQGGANALGNTGGLTTGASGPAGIVGGGGGVHSGQLVIPPAPINGAMRSDETREHPRNPQDATTTSGMTPER